MDTPWTSTVTASVGTAVRDSFVSMTGLRVSTRLVNCWRFTAALLELWDERWMEWPSIQPRSSVLIQQVNYHQCIDLLEPRRWGLGSLSCPGYGSSPVVPLEGIAKLVLSLIVWSWGALEERTMKPHSSSLSTLPLKLSRLMYAILCYTTLGIIIHFINLLQTS